MKKVILLSLSILIILFLSIIFVTKTVSAEDINYALDGTATFNGISYEPHHAAPTWYSVASNINDNNISTYVGFDCILWADYEAIVEFTEVVPVINKVNYTREWKTFFGSNEKVYLYYGGDWHLINTYHPTGSGVGTMEITKGGPWNNVSKIKLYALMSVGSGGARHHLFELRAFGPPDYMDIGLRVFNGTEVVSIAAEPEGTLTSPLRIAKNGVIYGIALVDPGDPNDSGVRIQTSSGIKALRRL